MYMTLDGIAEFPVYEGVQDDGSDDPMWTPRMGNIDTLLLGATAYQKWFAFWPSRKSDPTAIPWEAEYSRFTDRVEKVVFSKSLEKADWPNSRIFRGDPAEEVARLKSRPGKDIALGGGPRLAQSFLAEGLVDEMFLSIFPSIVGKGKPLFRVSQEPDNPRDMIKEGTPGRHDFRLLESKQLKDGTLFVHYEKK
jgi:dihydrofolate reductase